MPRNSSENLKSIDSRLFELPYAVGVLCSGGWRVLARFADEASTFNFCRLHLVARMYKDGALFATYSEKRFWDVGEDGHEVPPDLGKPYHSTFKEASEARDKVEKAAGRHPLALEKSRLNRYQETLENYLAGDRDDNNERWEMNRAFRALPVEVQRALDVDLVERLGYIYQLLDKIDEGEVGA